MRFHRRFLCPTSYPEYRLILRLNITYDITYIFRGDLKIHLLRFLRHVLLSVLSITYISKCCDQTVTLNPAVEILVLTSLLYDIGPILFDIGRCVRDAKHGGPRSLSLPHRHIPLLTTRYTLPMDLVEYRGVGLTTISRVTR